jgi:lysophospholipase L1-like esterase
MVASRPAAAAAVAAALALLVLLHGPPARRAAADAPPADRAAAAAAAAGAVAPPPWPGAPGEPRDMDWWRALHEELRAEAAAAAEQGGLDVALFGDSITEGWRGTAGGGPNPKYSGSRALFDELFRERFPRGAEAFGEAGDQGVHLVWRLRQGELAAGAPPRVAVVLIGTNELGWAASQAAPGSAAAAVLAAVPVAVRGAAEVVRLLRAASPRTQVLLQALLPRGGRDFRQPSLFTPALVAVNAALEAVAAASGGGVDYVDCGAAFLTDDGEAIREELMPDGLHPAGEGQRAMGECVADAAAGALARRAATDAAEAADAPPAI